MPPLPFPQRLAKVKLDSQFTKCFDVLKELLVNIPLIDALYAKFLKEILSNKRKIDEHETITLGEKCKVVVLNKFRTNLQDPDSFSVT